jgi:hypothetical protein
MKQRYLLVVTATILTAGLVDACAPAEEVSAPAEEVSEPPAQPSPVPSIEPSPLPSPEEVAKSVPDVIGKRIGKARAVLEASGFFMTVRKKTSQEPPGTVLAMSSEPGSELEPGDSIRITVAKAPPPPKPAPEVVANCHSSYEGACLDPNASDYDCAGGSGNGPEYTGFVTVVGPDVFDLDADGDGVGCE